MSGSVNKVIIVGRCGKDPEVRTMQDGNKIVHLSVATSERWTDKQSGEKKEKTEWHRVVIWNERLGDFAERYLRKGSQVYLEGALQTRKWTGNDGVEKYTTEVVLQRFRGELTVLDSRNANGGEERNEIPAPASGGSGVAPRGGGISDLDADEIPFATSEEFYIGGRFGKNRTVF